MQEQILDYMRANPLATVGEAQRAIARRNREWERAVMQPIRERKAVALRLVK